MAASADWPSVVEEEAKQLPSRPKDANCLLFCTVKTLRGF